jgi:uncharacterized iron-regulated membrane protein
MLALHRWVGLVVGAMILVAAGTAIALNHQDQLLRPVKAGPATSPYARYMLSLTVDPKDARHLLAGTSDGLFRSVDGGKTWEDAVLPVPAEQVVAIEADPVHPGTVYAAFRKIGVYRSDDAGDLWEEVPLPFNPAEGTTLQAIDVTAAGLTLLTSGGLYQQHGADWAHVAPPASHEAAEAGAGLKLVYALHDGTFWGTWGVPVTDAVSASLIVLVLSGYVVFFARIFKVRRARRRRAVAEVARA